jgi:hypothetical protein
MRTSCSDHIAAGTSADHAAGRQPREPEQPLVSRDPGRHRRHRRLPGRARPGESRGSARNLIQTMQLIP